MSENTIEMQRGALKEQIIDHLESGPATSKELANKIDASKKSIYTVLKRLEIKGVVKETGLQKGRFIEFELIQYPDQKDLLLLMNFIKKNEELLNKNPENVSFFMKHQDRLILIKNKLNSNGGTKQIDRNKA